jgi:ABC-type bacteriocin/lantibiotic exporter with double-glycine peptidase domain
LGLALPLLTAFVVDQVLLFRLSALLPLLAAGLLVVIVAQAVLTVLRSALLLYLQTRVDTSMMLGFFEQLIALPLRFFQVGILLASSRPIGRLSKQELLTEGKFQGYATEALIGITTLKAAGAEQHALDRWTNLFFEQMNASVRRSYLSALVNNAVTNLLALAPLLLLLIGPSRYWVAASRPARCWRWSRWRACS